MTNNAPIKVAISKIHELPGISVEKQSDKAYSGLVSSIVTQGIQEPLILRQREDGEYQLVSGYRRLRAGELAKLKEVPALVYDMSEKVAVEYYKESRTKPDLPVPGKLIEQTKPEEKKEAAAKSEKKATAPKVEKAEKKKTEPEKEEPAAVSGPAGTAISQVLESRLTQPDAKSMKELPLPKDKETFFVMLHPDYLEKSEFNNFSVDRDSENYKELRKSIELNGIKDPVLARPKKGGGLEVLSGQRRLTVAKDLNYPVPTLIQNIDDDDARILVADGNLHRDKITTYDLSRAMKMKMEAMKRKAGRRRKSAPSIPKLDSDELLAKEMGMSTSKLNRLIKLSEATQDVCSRVDDGTLALSIASNIAFLQPKIQDDVIRLMDLGYKLSNDNTNTLKTVAKSESLTEEKMRAILDGNYPPREIPKPVTPVMPEPQPVPTAAPAPSVQHEPIITKPSEIPIPPAPKIPDSVSAPVVEAVKTEQPAAAMPVPAPIKRDRENEYETKIVLRGDRLRKYFPDVSMPPHEIEESVYSALEERRQRQEKMKQKAEMFKGSKEQAR